MIEQRNIAKEKHNIDVKFFFHSGETSISDGPVAGNVFNAVLLKPKRIGHGLSLYKFPVVL